MMPGMGEAARRAPAISAHRGGRENARGGTYEAYRSAAATGAEYVEFDVRRTSDGVLVACHHGRAGWGPVSAVSYGRLCRMAGYEMPRAAEVMRLLAGRTTGHLDLKDASCAPALVDLAVSVLGPAGFLVTTGDAALAARLKRCYPAVQVGLSIGGDLAQSARFAARRAHTRRVSRLDPVLAARADWAVVHHRLARTGVLGQCRARGIKTMVWTVNGGRALARWLASPQVDVLVTDRPARAVAVRAGAVRGPGGEGRIPVG
jgi:glycerophosphoryl diester phosphodiesterase